MVAVVVILLVLMILLSLFISISENKVSKIAEQRRKEFLENCSEEQQQLIAAYRNAVKVDIKDAWKRQKKSK